MTYEEVRQADLARRAERRNQPRQETAFFVYDADGARVLDTLRRGEAFRKARSVRGLVTDRSGRVLD